MNNIENNVLNNFSELKDYNVIQEAARSSYYLYCNLIVEAFSENMSKWSVFGQDLCADFIDNKVRYYFFFKNYQLCENFLNSALKDSAYFQKLEEDIQRLKEKSIKKFLDVAHLNRDELILLVREFVDDFKRFIDISGILREHDHGVRNYFSSRYSGNKLDHIFMTVSNGEEKHMSFNRQEEVQVLRYAIHIQQENIKHDTSKWNTLIDHLFDSFRWSVCGYYNELPRTRDNYRALLLDALSRNPYEELTSIEQKIQKDISLRNELLSALTEEEQKVADIVQQIVYLKDYYKSQCNEFLCKAEPFFERLSEVLGWKIHDLKNLNEDEMVTLLQDKPIDLALVAQRNKQSIPITWNGHFNVLVNEQALLFKETFLNTTSNVPLQYKGRTACRGLVEGIARVVLRKEEFAEFNEREILVAFNTSPDYVPIMKRASAIIAEEGGLTSHTAIVARELNIPCIVGIDHITDFVYTGDRLRVDASNGVIEIVEKHE